MLGIADEVINYYPAISYIMLGVFGFIGLAIGLLIYNFGSKYLNIRQKELKKQKYLGDTYLRLKSLYNQKIFTETELDDFILETNGIAEDIQMWISKNLGNGAEAAFTNIPDNTKNYQYSFNISHNDCIHNIQGYMVNIITLMETNKWDN